MTAVYIIGSALSFGQPFLISQVLFQHLDLAMDFMPQCLRAILEPLTTLVLTKEMLHSPRSILLPSPCALFPSYSLPVLIFSNYFKVNLIDSG